MYIDTGAEFRTLRSLVDLLLRRATYSANQTAYTFLEDGEDVAETITYAEFAQRVLALAAALEQRFSPRDRPTAW